ncbi:MAG TPA: hypothetical protein VIX15_06520 [Streptosporangiaceae bacterium]
MRQDADGSGPGRRRSRSAWGAAAAALATAAFAAALLAHGGPADHRAPATQAAAAHGMPSAMAACERSRKVCDPAAETGFPLTRPAAPGARLLTEQQVTGRSGWRGDVVRARLMTYGQAARAYPALAASAVIAPSRPVWVLTVYFARPVTIDSGYGPPGAPATMTISAMSEVIDASTGTPADQCEGCAVIPRSG